MNKEAGQRAVLHTGGSNHTVRESRGMPLKSITADARRDEQPRPSPRLRLVQAVASPPPYATQLLEMNTNPSQVEGCSLAECRPMQDHCSHVRFVPCPNPSSNHSIVSSSRVCLPSVRRIAIRTTSLLTQRQPLCVAALSNPRHYLVEKLAVEETHHVTEREHDLEIVQRKRNMRHQ